MIENQSVKDRILIWIEHHKLTRASFERACGLGNGYVDGLKGAGNPKKMDMILRTYPSMSRNWLLFGEGSMLNPDIEDSPAQPADSAARPTTLDKALDEIAAQRRMMEKSQEQIDRLLSIIERMNGAK